MSLRLATISAVVYDTPAGQSSEILLASPSSPVCSKTVFPQEGRLFNVRVNGTTSCAGPDVVSAVRTIDDPVLPALNISVA